MTDTRKVIGKSQNIAVSEERLRELREQVEYCFGFFVSQPGNFRAKEIYESKVEIQRFLSDYERYAPMMEAVEGATFRVIPKRQQLGERDDFIIIDQPGEQLVLRAALQAKGDTDKKEPGEEAGLGKTGAPESYVGPGSKNLSPVESPGLTDEEAVKIIEQTFAWGEGADPYRDEDDGWEVPRAALAHIKGRLAGRKVTREWAERLSEVVERKHWNLAIAMLRKHGIEVEDKT